jgi:hypothetical protein
MKLTPLILGGVLLITPAGAQDLSPGGEVPVREQAAASDCKAGGNLTGTVFGYSQNPIRKAEIWVIGTRVTIKTDSHGRFSVQNLQPGSYALTFSKKGFALGKMENVTIVCGHDSVVLLTFHRVPPSLVEKIDVPYCTLAEEKIDPKSSSIQRTLTLDELDKTPHGHSVSEVLLSP